MTLPLFNIGGLASGLDTTSMIDALLEVERIPVVRLQARRATYEAKDAAWADVSTRLSALRSATKSLDALADFDTFVSGTSSQPDAVAVTISGAAATGATTFTVDRLATNHQVASGDFGSGSDLVGAGSFTLTVGGADHVVATDGTTTLAGLAAAIDALDVGVSASVVAVDASTVKLVLTGEDTGATSAFTTSSTLAGLDTMSVLQQGDDALLTLGSGPGALQISRASNTVTDLVAGAALDLRATTASPVTVTVARDVDAAVAAVTTLVDELNATLSTLAAYTDYNAESRVAGALQGDGTARSLIGDLRLAVSGHVSDLNPALAHASAIGISLTREGTFAFDAAKLRAALEDDFDAVAGLAARAGHAVDARLGFVATGAGTVDGAYEVVITQAASAASVTGTKYKKPAVDTTFQIVVDGTTVDVTVDKNEQIADAVTKINDALSAAGVSTLTASEVTLGSGNPAIQLDDSRIGGAYSFQVVGDPFGLTGTHTGTDVAGTIGGEAATGAGTQLTADGGDPTGLVVKVTATQADVDAAGGSLSLGDVVVSNGFVGRLTAALDLAEGAGGAIDRARDRWQNQIDLIDDRIDVFEDRIERKEALLIRQFAALETAMAALTAQANFLSSQLLGQQQ